MGTSFDEFLGAFEMVRAECEDRPSTLESRTKLNSSIRKNVLVLYTKYHAAVETILHAPGKVVAADTALRKALSKYENEYQGVVGDLFIEYVFEAPLNENEASEFYNDYDSIDEEIISEIRTFRVDMLPKRVVSDFIEQLDDLLVNDTLSDNINVIERISLGIRALRILQNELQVLDFDGVLEKWREAPELFLKPPLVEQSRAHTSLSPYLMLAEAIRAYVLDVPLACMALCRAATETILRHHVKLSSSFGDLDVLIGLAEDERPEIRKLNLGEHRKRANQVLHKPADLNKSDWNHYSLKYLQALKILLRSVS